VRSVVPPSEGTSLVVGNLRLAGKDDTPRTNRTDSRAVVDRDDSPPNNRTDDRRLAGRDDRTDSPGGVHSVAPSPAVDSSRAGRAVGSGTAGSSEAVGKGEVSDGTTG
jgi:hypothetical protein